MDFISRLITAALDACFHRGVIDWLPNESGAPSSFLAECEIELNSYTIGDLYSGDFYVRLAGVLCFVDMDEALIDGECTWWHSELIGAA